MKDSDKKIRVLFLCTGNSCRSQMAEGWARYLMPDKIEAYSAGTKKRVLDSLAVQAMAEVGVDISGQKSKTVEELPKIEFDYVITLCDNAYEACPLFPGKTKVFHHGFDDPPRLAANTVSAEEARGHYRRVRDEIRAFVESLPESILKN